MKFKYFAQKISLTINDNRCVGCGRCIGVCPQRVLMLKGKSVKAVKFDECIECGACMVNCPFGAIFVKSGVGCANAVLGTKCC